MEGGLLSDSEDLLPEGEEEPDVFPWGGIPPLGCEVDDGGLGNSFFAIGDDGGWL